MKGKTHDLNNDLTFSAHTINCVCHSIRSTFRVLGIYNFDQDPPSLLPKNAVINCFGLLGCPSFSFLLRPRPCTFLPIQWRLLQSTVQKMCKSETQPELPSLLKNLELKKGWDEKSDTYSFTFQKQTCWKMVDAYFLEEDC